jgi:ubiquinone/menaquinone biosynthesis C-methylase UbiE
MKKRPVDYNFVATKYDCRYEVGDYSGIQQSLLEFVGGAKWGTLLEVGCGTGHWLQLLTSRGFNVTGLDPAPSMLDIAKKKAPQVQLVLGPAEFLSFKEGVFDRVFCINSFHHFSNHMAFLNEAYRVLRREGGIMTVGLDPHTGLDTWWIYDYFSQVLEIDQRRYFPTRRIRRMMQAAGFKDCATSEAQHTPWQMPARTAFEIGRQDKTYTSQLTVLNDDEYSQGINHLVKQIESSEDEGSSLTISADLRVYATIGWKK